jgi:hypothetical protein
MGKMSFSGHVGFSAWRHLDNFHHMTPRLWQATINSHGRACRIVSVKRTNAGGRANDCDLLMKARLNCDCGRACEER